LTPAARRHFFVGSCPAIAMGVADFGERLC
jgi:hypothetical protein